MPNEKENVGKKMDENDPPSAVCIELQNVQYKYEYRKEMSNEKKSNTKKAKKK